MASKLNYNEDAAALTWEVLNNKKDIGKWELLYKGRIIEGKGFKDFLSAAINISNEINVIYVKYIRYFITVSLNFIDYSDKDFFVNTKYNFYYIFCAENVELRNWDNFWDDTNNKEEFLNRLNTCRECFKKECKNKLSLKSHYRYSLARDQWEDIKYKYYLKANTNICKEMLPQDRQEYETMERLFKSSFYYSNPKFHGRQVIKVHQYDIHSSHIGFMARKKYPYEHFTRTNNIEEIQEIINGKFYCWYACICFKKLQYKNPDNGFEIDLRNFGYPIPEYQCSWELYLTNVDMDWFKKCFTWEDLVIIDFYYARQKELVKIDKKYVDMVDSLYRIKAAQKKGTFAKQISKFRAELPYGQPIKSIEYYGKIVYDEKTNNFELSQEEEEDMGFKEIQNKLISRGLPRYWSLWTVAYSRREFYLMLDKIGFDNVIYGDTDSVKFTGEEGVKLIEEYNKEIDEEVNLLIKKYKIYFHPELGRWGNEGDLISFKAIAIKWYITRDFNNVYDVKAAGANIKAIKDWIKTREFPIFDFKFSAKIPNIRFIVNEDRIGKTVEFKYLNKIGEDFKRELFKKQQTTALYYFNPYEDKEANVNEMDKFI